ncbi:MAG: ribbon-helix-helix protein, CopG family [Spirochaetia bacterium]|jgi:predicted transcriptional regulator
MSYVKTAAITIRLDPDMELQLDRLAKRTGRSRSDVAREALRRQLSVLQFEEARRQIMPFAEARGYLTDDDVFRVIS